MKSKRISVASLALVLCVVLACSGCGSTDLDSLLLWSDRVVGYTDTARQLMLDIHCEECEVHPISLKATLDRLRELQKLHTAHGEYYAILRANRSGDTITLDTSARAKLDAIAPKMRDKVSAVQIGLPSDVSNRIAPTTALLSEAVNTLIDNISSVKPGKDGVIKITFEKKQKKQFDDVLARVEKTDRQIVKNEQAIVALLER